MKILPVFIPHQGCPFACIFCNQKTITKTSKNDLEKIKNQIAEFCRFNQNLPKEVAFFGGTFTNLPLQIQKKYFNLVEPFFAECSIRFSTRPDAIDQEILTFCKQNNVTTIELGIQSFADSVLIKSQRGYDPQTAINACKLIKNMGFKLCIQLMPGLPESSAKTWQESITRTVKLKPHYVRIYPTIVLKNTELARMYKNNEYKPLTLESAIEQTATAVTAFEEKDIKIIKIGLHSDIEPDQILAGPYHESFGELVKAEILMQRISKNFTPKTLIISAKDISLFKGFKRSMLNKLKEKHNLEKLPVIVSHELATGKFLFTEKSPQNYW